MKRFKDRVVHILFVAGTYRGHSTTGCHLIEHFRKPLSESLERNLRGSDLGWMIKLSPSHQERLHYDLCDASRELALSQYISCAIFDNQSCFTHHGVALN